MSDANSITNQNKAILGRDDPVPFTWPEGFNTVANSLQFLPEEARSPVLMTFLALLTLV
jgi:hypothetical protein